MDEARAGQDDIDSDQMMFALRVVAYVVAMVAAPIAAFCWGSHAVSWHWSVFSTIAAIATAATVVALAVLLWRPRPVVLMSVVMVWCVLAALLCYPMALRMQCGAHAIITGTHVRAIAQIGMNEIRAKGQLPPSFAVYDAEHGELSRWERRPRLCDSLADVKVGQFTLQDFADGRVWRKM